MKLGGYIEFITLYCMGLFSTSGSDPEPEVAHFPITSYMFNEKNNNIYTIKGNKISNTVIQGENI